MREKEGIRKILEGQSKTNEVNSLEAVSLSRHILQVLFQGLAELSQLLLGNIHLLADQVEGLKREKER